MNKELTLEEKLEINKQTMLDSAAMIIVFKSIDRKKTKRLLKKRFNLLISKFYAVEFEKKLNILDKIKKLLLTVNYSIEKDKRYIEMTKPEANNLASSKSIIRHLENAYRLYSQIYSKNHISNRKYESSQLIADEEDTIIRRKTDKETEKLEDINQIKSAKIENSSKQDISDIDYVKVLYKQAGANNFKLTDEAKKKLKDIFNKYSYHTFYNISSILEFLKILNILTLVENDANIKRIYLVRNRIKEIVVNYLTSNDNTMLSVIFKDFKIEKLLNEYKNTYNKFIKRFSKLSYEEQINQINEFKKNHQIEEKALENLKFLSPDYLIKIINVSVKNVLMDDKMIQYSTIGDENNNDIKERLSKSMQLMDLNEIRLVYKQIIDKQEQYEKLKRLDKNYNEKYYTEKIKNIQLNFCLAIKDLLEKKDILKVDKKNKNAIINKICKDILEEKPLFTLQYDEEYDISDAIATYNYKLRKKIFENSSMFGKLKQGKYNDKHIGEEHAKRF